MLHCVYLYCSSTNTAFLPIFICFLAEQLLRFNEAFLDDYLEVCKILDLTVGCGSLPAVHKKNSVILSRIQHELHSKTCA